MAALARVGRFGVFSVMVVPNPLAGFHPAVQAWFSNRFAAPTEAQIQGWPAIRSGRHALIAAPTGSGKTLAAFLAALNDLLVEGIVRHEAGEPGLPDEVRVVYVSPLKALSADVHKNLIEPRRGIREAAEALGLPPVRITAAVRSGDTPQYERQAMVKTPPHVLVTTPESLYLLLTAERGREMLRTVRTVIVDEIHAVIQSRRGAHLALTLERLEHVAGEKLQRIGLSATQEPVAEVARYLVGAARVSADGRADCKVVDEGHLRQLDLALELPPSPLEAVMAREVWEEVYERLVALTLEHRTTLVFVNTRRLAERIAHDLSGRLGEGAVTAHHGSLSKETRLDAERRLKSGELKALIATSSLELGIDIGHVDLVCQIGSPHRVAAFLQRVGRSGHHVGGVPKGRLFPLSRDDLVECAALLRAVQRGTLDRLWIPQGPLDVLAQQVVAESAAEPWSEESLRDRFRRAWPYRGLTAETFEDVLEMVSTGFTTRRGRRGALVHRDRVNAKLRGKKGARITAITSGGAIPDTADYRVVLEPEGSFLGTVNEDFAVESMAGDVMQLGNASWRILRVQEGTVRVEDARGEPPSIPFWLGEAPGRSDELSAAVSELRAAVDALLDEHGVEIGRARAQALLESETGIGPAAAFQIVHYLSDAKRVLGSLPTQETLVLERFFDEAGGMQLVLHAPFGSRVNRAWGLSLRKRFCRQFNFELQAAATEEAVLLSLGPQHSFPLDDVFRFLASGTVRDVLIQALLDSPMFQTRWRWNATLSLALLRWRGGAKTPAPIQRMEAEDLLAAVFPDAAACLENIPGDRELPDHPLVNQTIEDCLTEAMDLPALEAILRRLEKGGLRLVSRDTPEPSTLSAEVLNARPYSFLDDAPLEERRARAVYTRRALDPASARELGALDEDAIRRVRDEAWPDPGTPDELHDALLTSGFLTEEEGEAQDPSWRPLLDALAAEGRAGRVELAAAADGPASVPDASSAGGAPVRTLWIATERLPELLAVHPDARVDRALRMPARGWGAAPARDRAIRDLLRGRVDVLGPVTSTDLGADLGVSSAEALAALYALESEGIVLRGRFTPGRAEDVPEEWCERRLLARIHRYTLDRLRAEIQPVSPADFMRFLFRWQRVEPGQQGRGPEALAAVLEMLDGSELPAVAWEADVLPARIAGYEPELLDRLCLAGRVSWGRLSAPTVEPSGRRGGGPLRSTRVALFQRESAPSWEALAASSDHAGLGEEANRVREALARRGASFFGDLVSASGLLPTRVEAALGELAAAGLVTSDSFAGLRALLTPSDKRPSLGEGRRGRGLPGPYGVDSAGRWALLRSGAPAGTSETASRPWERPEVERFARALLRRYGVVFRRLLLREPLSPPWRDLVMVYRSLEARGEVRGGRFITGFTGEQFALAEAVSALRAVRREEARDELIVISAADPLNLTGVATPGERVAAVTSTRIGYRAGVPVFVRERGEVRSLASGATTPDPQTVRALGRRSLAPSLRSYVGHR
jgi:ATP-dependent Lhr-like helicase